MLEKIAEEKPLEKPEENHGKKLRPKKKQKKEAGEEERAPSSFEYLILVAGGILLLLIVFSLLAGHFKIGKDAIGFSLPDYSFRGQPARQGLYSDLSKQVPVSSAQEEAVDGSAQGSGSAALLKFSQRPDFGFFVLAMLFLLATGALINFFMTRKRKADSEK